MKKIFQKTISAILIFAICSTNVFALNWQIQDEWKFEDWKLFAILLDEKLSENTKIFDWVKKYWKNIAKKFPDLTPKIFLIDENQTQKEIFSKLELLYFNGLKEWNAKLFLDWFFAIWDIPIPEIEIWEGFETKKSFFPYTDFEEKFFVFDNKKQNFVRQEEISEQKSEVFFWFLRKSEKQKDLWDEFYENYFDKLNNFYDEWVKNFDENKIFLADLDEERKSANETLMKQYEKASEFQYEIAYQKFSSEFANKLQDDMVKDLLEPVCATYQSDEEKKIGLPASEHCVVPNKEALTAKIGNSDLISVFQVKKLLPEYYDVVESYVKKANDLIFKSWEKKANLETIPKEIFIKDFLAREYIKAVNQTIEERIISDLQNYVDGVNQKVEELYCWCLWWYSWYAYNQRKYNCNNYTYNYTNWQYNICQNVPNKIILEINNWPTKKDIKNQIENWLEKEDGLTLKVDQKNNIYFKDDWNEFSFYLPNLFESEWNLDKYVDKYLIYLNWHVNKFSDTEFRLEYSKYLYEYHKQELGYYDGNFWWITTSNNYVNTGKKLTFDEFIQGKGKKSIPKSFFTDIIQQSKDDFKYFFDWMKVKKWENFEYRDINSKRKKILEDKIFQNKEKIYQAEPEKNFSKIDNFSTLYFRSWNFWKWENFYIQDINWWEKNRNSKFELAYFWDWNKNIDDELKEKCWSYNWVPLPKWFGAIKCWIKDISKMWDKQICWWWNKDSWENFWNWKEFTNDINERNIDFQTAEEFEEAINPQEQKDYEFWGDKDYIADWEILQFTVAQKWVWIIKDWHYNSVQLEFKTVDKDGNLVDFTWYARFEFVNDKWNANWLIADEDLFFENWVATTGLVTKEKRPYLKLYRPWFKNWTLYLSFSKSWLAKDLVSVDIPDDVEKIDIKWANFYSAYLFWNKYVNLKNWVAFDLINTWSTLAIFSAIDDYNFYNWADDKIVKIDKIKSRIDDNYFWIWFWDDEKSMMKFLSWDFIWNSVKTENWIFSAVLGDPMISFENKKDEAWFTKTIWKSVYKFSWDIDKIEIIDYNSDWQEDFLAFMNDWFIKLFKWENWSFTKKWDLAYFSSNVEKQFVWDVDWDWDQDFIVKLYDWREVFFENKDEKFSKKLLGHSVIENYLQWKTERFDLPKNVLDEDDAKNQEYWKSDIQWILEKAWGVDNDLEYANWYDEKTLDEKLQELNWKLSDAVDLVSNLTCMGWSCISSPVNWAFMVPWAVNVPWFLKQAISFPTAPVSWSPVFWIVWWPTPPDWTYKPFPCSWLACYWPAPWIPTNRYYISPTITWWLWFAYCKWPQYIPFWSPSAMCFVTALPVNQLWICKQTSLTGLAMWAIWWSPFKSWWGDWKNSVFSQMLWSWWIPENDDAYVIWLDKTKIKIFDENNKTMNPFFSWFLTRWWDKQVKEIVVNWLDFPVIKLILPDFNSWFETLKSSWDKIKLKDNKKIFNFESNLKDEKEKLKNYQKSLEKKNDKKWLFKTIKSDKLKTDKFIEFKWNVQWTAKTIEESYDEIFKQIDNLPILQLKREKINLDIPRINPYKLNSLIIQINDFIERNEEILNDLPKDQFPYLRNYIKQLKKNLEVLKTYRDFPQEIMKYRFLLSKYIWDVISLIDCLTDYLWWWIARNKKIAIAYIKLYYEIKAILELLNNISLVFDDYKNSCSACKASSYLSNFSLAQLFMSLIPEPPVIKMPKWPDIIIDLSDVQLWITVNIPEINFRVREVYIPNLDLPTLWFWNLNLPMLKIPPFDLKLPELPEIPAVEIPKLPDLPPPPKLPELPFLDSINSLMDTIKLVLKLYCLIFQKWLFVYPENTVKQIVEWLTNRSSSNFLPLDFLFLQFPNISYPTLKSINIDTHLNLKFEDNTMYEKLQEEADKLNIYKKLWEDINNVIWTFNEKSSELWSELNEKTNQDVKIWDDYKVKPVEFK